MSQVLVWRSDADGKLFEDKKKYTNHLRKLSAERTRVRKIKQVNDVREQFLTDMGKVPSIIALEQFVADNWSWFFHNGISHAFNSRRHPGKHELISLEFEVKWSDSVSNSHCCPRTGATNWNRRTTPPGTPTGYPGWHGNIKIRVRGAPYPIKTPEKVAYHDAFGSDYFNNTMINTGSGGGGGKDEIGACRYQYGVSLFAADFPGLAEAREKAIVWNQVSGTNMVFA